MENGKFPVFFLGDTHSSIKENGIEIENGKLRWGGGDTPHMHQCQGWIEQAPKPKLDPSGGGKGGPISKL